MALRTFSFACKAMSLGYALTAGALARGIPNPPCTTLHRQCYRTTRIVVVIHR